MAGVYIHIPFCLQACHYCNFHFSTSLSRMSEMINAICSEIENGNTSEVNSKLSSIYFGGGTPSLLSKRQLESILDSLAKKYTWDRTAEITLEANPEDITSQYLEDLKSVGINRLSIGIQSFDSGDLSYMNRAHNVEQSHSALRLINEAEFRSYTLDLMFGLINRKTKDWESNITTALSYKPPHMSCYNLTIEEQTAFGKWKTTGKLSESKDSLQQEQYNLAESMLISHGYDHYEISNYAQEGHHAIHNSNYWNKINYVGYGPGAHSYIDTVRSWNISNNNKYVTAIKDNINCQESETLSQEDQYNELVMLGLRTKKGIDKNKLENQEVQIKKHWDSFSKPLIEEGVLIDNQDSISLDSSWWYLSDDITARLFIENEK